MNEGCVINLDKGEGQIQSAILTDSIYNACSVMNIEFDSPSMLYFDGNRERYLTYMNNKWIPVSYKIGKTNIGTWHLSCTCLPYAYGMIITKPTTDTFSLASQLGLELVGESLKIDCPIIGKTPVETVHRYRLNSLIDAHYRKNMSEAMFLYFNSSALTSTTYSSLLKKNAHTFENFIDGQSTDIVNYCDETNELYLKSTHGCHPWSQNDFINRMLGRKFEIITPNNAMFMDTYSMRFKTVPEFDNDGTYLCIYSSLNVTKFTGFVNVFAEVLYV